MTYKTYREKQMKKPLIRYQMIVTVDMEITPAYYPDCTTIRDMIAIDVACMEKEPERFLDMYYGQFSNNVEGKDLKISGICLRKGDYPK